MKKDKDRFMNQNIPWSLINKFFDGEYNIKEQEELTRWINSSAGNKYIFNELEQVWNFSKSNDADFIPDLEQAWQNINSKIDTGDTRSTKQRKKSKIQSLIYYSKRVAAVLLIGISLVAVYYLAINKKSPSLIEVITSNDDRKSVDLFDNSRVWINSFSKLTFPEVFNKNQREITLEGEAFFDITIYSDQPFVINTQNAFIKVMGTSFNVRSMPGEEEITVTVSEGKVMFSLDNNFINNTIILGPGDMGILNKNFNLLHKEVNNDINYLSWKTRKLEFSKTSLNSVVKILQRVYEKEISFKENSLKTLKFTASFDNQPLNEVLEVIATALKIKYETSDDKIILSGDI